MPPILIQEGSFSVVTVIFGSEKIFCCIFLPGLGFSLASFVADIFRYTDHTSGSSNEVVLP